MPVNVVYLYAEPTESAERVMSQFDMLLCSLKSLVSNSDPDKEYNISVYISNVPESSISEIIKLSTDNIHVACIDIGILGATSDVETHIYKLNVLDLACKVYDRFVYLDNDTVVLCDISELYFINIDSFIGGVEDYSSVYIDKRNKPGYINSGILLIDADSVRRGSFVFSDLAHDKNTKYDEPILNNCGIKISLLPSAYNVTVYQCMYYGAQQVLTAKILHFAGPKQFNRPILFKNKRFTTLLSYYGYQVPEDLVVNYYKNSFEHVTVVYFYKPDNISSNLNSISQKDQLRISISGILKHANVNRHYNIYIYYTDDTTSEQLHDFESMSNDTCTIHTIKFSPPRQPEDSLMGIWISKLYTLEQAVSRFNRFLFLDNDTVVLCDIADVFDMDLMGNPVGGVTDILYYANHYRIGGRNYVNGGLYLIDSIKVRSSGISFASLDHLAKELVWGDEPAVNSGFKGQTKILPLEYNMTPDHLKIFGRQQINIAKIIHFAGKKDFIGRELLRVFPEFTKIAMDAGYKDAIPDTRIFLGRKFDAVGDAIMFGDVVNTINYMCPYINIDVCVGDTTRKILTAMGCHVRYLETQPSRDGYIGYIEHVVYPNPLKNRNVHMLAGMMTNVMDSIPLLRNFKLDSIKVFPCSKTSNVDIPEYDYVIVPSSEVSKPGSADKFYNNFGGLVDLLSTKFNVVELNTNSDKKTYDGSVSVLHLSDFADTAKILRHAKFVVTLENGLNHWACHNMGKTYCLMTSRRLSPGECFYSGMTPIECYENESPEYVFSEIMKHEEKR